MATAAATYVELQITSHFSFLRGSSSPEELFAAAKLLGHEALGLADRGTVAGVVRGWDGQKATGVRMIAGARVDLTDGRALLLYPSDRRAWSRLTRLLTTGKARGGKGRCILDWNDIAAHADGLMAILVPDMPDAITARHLGELRELFGACGYLALSLRRRPDDIERLYRLDALARSAGMRSVATGDILYHAPEARPLQDVMTAIREKTTIDALGFRRERFMDRNLKSPAEMERRFAAFPDAIQASADIAGACRFDLGEIQYQYPYEQVMEGRTAQEALAAMTEAAAERLFPDGLPQAYRRQIDHELRLIDQLGYAPYFLTVNSIVAESRRRGILCQGRGSAANSCVCYFLGITSIDPIQHELLFERFVSGERKEPPDIDVDFEHERREEIIQWIYETYGRQRSALTAVVTRYRTRGAVAEVGKALGLPRDLTKMLTGLVWGWSVDGITDEQIASLNLNAEDHRLKLTLQLARQLIGQPRHLSQHPGGFVLTQDRLDDLVPIEPARMEDRQIIEWDKDDIDALKFMKVDVLGLGMLGCLNRAFNLLEDRKGIKVGMADLQDDDPAVYAMIQKADTLGVFQIESRAQMNMLPRMKPKEFYDLVIEVAIVRPGPIQGDMVHPYLRRREGKEKPEYPRPELRAVLEKTLGVPLFQEQAMKVAIVGAGFTPVEADQLRRAMATFKLTGGVSHFYDKLVGGMVARGYPQDFAERTFKQIEGFGSYGFPESHAASFAKIAYASCWMKHHHPDVFCAALLNAQPMGFYAPAQIVRDARAHGVEVRPVSINDSHWDCTLEPTRGRYMAVRLGFRQVRGLANAHGAAIAASRGGTPYESVEEVWRRAGTPRAAIERLAEADTFSCLAENRRQGLWKVKGLGEAPLPLFAAADARDEGFSPEGLEPVVTLRPMTDGREVVEDYRSLQLTSAYYLTLQWLPPADDSARAQSWLYEGGADAIAAAADHLSDFERETGRVLDLIAGVMPEAVWLDDSETLTYLHSTVSTYDQRIALPAVPMHLDALLADQSLTGGLSPQLGAAHLRSLSITGFPAVTVPGMLDELNRLGFAYRWTTRAICLDKVAAQRMLTRIRRLWFAKRKSLAAIIKEVMTNEASVLVDTDAANKSAEADQALQDLGADLAGFAYVTTTITVLGESPRDADLKLAAIEKIVRGRDFACIAEGLNGVEAWLGSLPGNPYANVRQPPVSTLNLAHIMPVSAVWAGPDRDAHFAAPPLLHARTEGSTPFRFVLHVGDVGHTLVVGPTGAGKSVLLALMALQFRRYQDAQLFAFDHGGSIRAATLGVGGEWHDLGGSLSGDAPALALQPLARIDELDERAWAADWLAAILGREGFATTPEVKEHLWTALGSLADAPVEQRTLSGLAVLIQASGLKRALAPYTLAGPYGRLLDGDQEHFRESDAQAFETEGLIGTPAAPAVLAYLFHRIGRRLDGRPTLILIDEGWLALDDPMFGRQLKEWLKTLRKKNASVIFATQSLADIEGSAIAPAIIESCPTRIFLANERALEPQIHAIYQRFGLNDRQIEIIAGATPKRDYYCQSALGNRLFDLGLGPLALAFTAASSRSDMAAITALLDAHGPEGFAAAWARHRGLDWAAELLIPDVLEPLEVAQ